MSKLPKQKYGILDDFGEVVRWVWEKPNKHYQYIVVKLQTEKLDLSKQEPASI